MTDPCFCCEMRRYVIFGIVATNGEAPTDMVDFVGSWDPLQLNSRYCPWCGHEIQPGEPRNIASPMEEMFDDNEDDYGYGQEEYDE